jgi:hypothetical protein
MKGTRYFVFKQTDRPFNSSDLVFKQQEWPIFQGRDLTVVKSFITSFRPIDIGEFIPCGDGLIEESGTALASTIEY